MKIDYCGRRQSLYQRINASSQGAYYTTDLTNIRYLTGFRGTAATLVAMKNKSVIFLDGRYPGGSQKQLKKGNDLKTLRIEESRLEALNKQLKNKKINSVYFEKNNLSYRQFRKIVNNLTASEREYGKDWVQQLRLRKEPAEIACIQKAIERTLEVFELAGEWIEPGITEEELNCFLRQELERRGENQSFYPLVLMGKRTAYPHAPPTQYKLQPGDPVLVDIGLKHRGYCSDLTRMYFCGENEAVKNLYQLSEKVTHSLFELLEPGVEISELVNQAKQIISEAGYSNNIRHGPGHGVGLEIHEPPNLGKNGEGKLKPGMVVTLEPGIYVQNTGGGRVEHMVKITDSKAKLLDKWLD